MDFVGFEKTVVDKIFDLGVIQTSKKLLAVLDCDISNFMDDFIFFISLYFWQNAKNYLNESSLSVQIKNMLSIKRSHILWKSLRCDVSNMSINKFV